MKKRMLVLIPYLLICAVIVTAVAGGGNVTDPLASLSYLNGTFTTAVNSAVDARLDASDKAIRSAVASGASSGAASVGSVASTWTEVRLKENDVLSGSTGLNVMVLAGSVKASFSSGALVDATTGTAVSSGATLSVRHRYLVAEDTTVKFSVTSLTAVVDYLGSYGFTYSSAVDYNAMATALKTMHLFKGSFTGYGSGYDLEVAPTRMQSLIMFIRVLGEEDAALAYTGAMPFTDITKGSDSAKYVGYAYAKGYTNGYTAKTFKPAGAVNAYQYTEFLLRALGYSSAENTDLSKTLERAKTSGVITAGEAAKLKSAKFLRAHLVYLSYCALDATVSGKTDTLRDTLIAKGVFTSAESASAKALVPDERIA